jgi:TatA/E family protein of Tat protein translocase
MNLGMPEMIFIFLLALLLFGPKKLPQVGRELGKALNEFKRASNEFKNQLETEIEQAEALERDKSSGGPPPQPLVEQSDAGASTAAEAIPAGATSPDASLAVPAEASAPAAGEAAWEPKIAPPAEPTVASTIGQSAILPVAASEAPPAPSLTSSAADPVVPPASQATASAREPSEPEQGAKAAPDSMAALPPPLPGVSAGSFDKATVRDSNA